MFHLVFLRIDREKSRHIENKLTSSIAHARADHTNGVYCERGTVVKAVKRIDSGIENGQECRATGVKSSKTG